MREQTSSGLSDTLQLVADTIVESLGFEVAVVNLVVADTPPVIVVAAVAGPAEVRDALLGVRQPLKAWHKMLAESEPWGKLSFLDHATSQADPDDIFTWIPDIPVSDHPDAWHPEDALFATLETGDGQLLGMLSVDMPRDRRRPGPATRHALEAFAVMASLALEHATLAQESERAARRFTAVFDSSPVPVAILGSDRRYERVNRAYCRFLQRDQTDLIGRSFREFTHPEDLELVEQASALTRRLTNTPATPETDGPVAVEKRYLLSSGEVAWGRLHLASLYGPDDTSVVVAQVEDITDRKRAEAQLVQQANFDALTSLPNRRQAMTHLQHVLDQGAQNGLLTAVFFCDLDRLKLVNDGHGHAVGDAYIREVGSRIQSAVRTGDLVGRLSGDEFVAVIEGLQAPTEAVGLAGRVIEHVRQPLSLGGELFMPSVSLGIAYSTGHNLTAEELLGQADSAMYRAKQEDRGAWHIYDITMRGSAAAHLELRRHVSAALEARQFVLHYQPIVRLHDEEVIGYEALLRWQHPRRGLLAPDQFLDVILDSEYEGPVTDWLIQQACLDASSRPAGSQRVSVNVSSLMVARPDLPAVITAALRASGLPPENLVLELTEDRLLSRPDGPDLLAGLSDMGLSIAMDDFGTGYAGLGYLQRFPSIAILKLDKSFIANLGTDHRSAHIVTAVRDLARNCGLNLIIEGIETAEQAQQLRSLDINLAQGYYFGKPQPLPTTTDQAASRLKPLNPNAPSDRGTPVR